MHALQLAQRQFGAIARRQLLEHGFSATRIRGWLHRGRLHRLYPGVYAWGRPDLGTEGELAAALLSAGQGSALGSLIALWWLQLLGRRPARVHVDAPGRAFSHADIVIRHPEGFRAAARSSGTCTGESRWYHCRRPCWPPLAPALGQLRLVLARAEFQRPALAADPGARRWARGATAAVPCGALGAHLPELAALRERSRARLRAALRALPAADARAEPADRSLPTGHALAGGDADRRARRRRRDSTPAQLAADRRRQADLEALGFAVLRFDLVEVRYEAAAVMAAVQRRLG